MNLKEQIARDGRYKSICKGLAKRPHMVDELYSEFLLAVCELDISVLENAKEEGYLEVYCVGMINNIWNKGTNQITIKKNANGKTSPFFEYSKFAVENPIFTSTPTYDHSIDYKFKKAKEIIKNDIISPDRETMYKSRIFYYSVDVYDNPRQLSKKTGITYRAILSSFKDYKEKLKRLLNE